MSARAGSNWRDSGFPSDIDEVFAWIEAEGFSYPKESLQSVESGVLDRPFNPSSPLIIASPVSRSKKSTKFELDTVLKAYREARRARVPTTNELKRIWEEARDPKSAVQSLDPSRISPDAIAFYRPFHLPPANEWGIYLFVDRLLEHTWQLIGDLKSVSLFTSETLTLCVLFEVFHHEFFHHMVESTATALELIFAAAGDPRPVYGPYCECAARLDHPDTPIEEALANAYAYVAFSFIVKVGRGYGAAFSRAYQETLKKSWPKEGEGYRCAANYIDGGTTDGSAMLLNLMLCGSPTADAPTRTLATHLFPRGHTALLSKPEIPTYLVGTPSALAVFNELIPAPNEAYSRLLIADDTTTIDTYISEARARERVAKKAAKAASVRTNQPVQQISLFEENSSKESN